MWTSSLLFLLFIIMVQSWPRVHGTWPLARNPMPLCIWLWPTWPSSSRSKTNAPLALTLPKFPLSTNRGVTGTRRSPWAWSSERALSRRLLQTLLSPSQGCRVSPWLWEAVWDLMVISGACSNGFLISVDTMAVLLDSSPGVFLFFFFNLYYLSSWIGVGGSISLRSCFLRDSHWLPHHGQWLLLTEYLSLHLCLC